MAEIIKVSGTSGKIFFDMSDGNNIIGDGEFRAASGKLDGFIVYKDSLRYKNSGTKLSPEEIDELLEAYESYKSVFIDWVIDFA